MNRHHLMIIYFIGLDLACIATGLTQGKWQLMAEPARMGRVLGVNGLFGNFGLTFAALLTGALCDLISWRAAFIVPGVVSLATGLVYWKLSAGLNGKAATKTAKRAVALDRRMMLRLFLILVGSTLAGGLIFSATTISMPKVFAERLPELLGKSGLGVGTIVCAIYVLAAFAQMLVGPMIDRMAMRRVLLPIAALKIPLILGAAYFEGWLLIVNALLMMFLVFGQIPINDAMVGRYITEQYRSRVFALRYLLSFGATAIPIVATFYRNGGSRPMFVALGCISLLTFAVALAFPDEDKINASGMQGAPA
ncbi:MAG: MFS transporter [Candidatus Protistobacter heckmanni]|nr:MFS transporter [Candidatus Protistobacter heckmanni]